MRTRLSYILTALVCALSIAVGRGEDVTFEQHIRPILKANCFHCHGESDELKGKLDVRLARLILKGGETGPAIATGKPAESLLLAKVKSGEMPEGEKKLRPEQIDLIEKWIVGGAKTLRPEPDDPAQLVFTEEERNFWSFQPVVRSAVPLIQATEVRTPIDLFLLQKLAEKSLTLSPEAPIENILIRRATFDLTGLPPTPEEIAAFTSDTSPDAYERLLDKLLVSPRYGERWGRHWLDAAGYADSDGYTDKDPARPWSYHYRDYVIRAFAADKPYDQFVTEQLAGDELAGPLTPNLTPQQIELLAATGFLRTAPDGTAGGIEAKLAGNAVVSETLKIVSTSLLGLTVGCAQCHNHRYDPVPQSDYYRLRAIFEPALNVQAWRAPPQRLVSLYTDADRAAAAAIEEEAKKKEQAIEGRVKELMQKVFEKELAKVPEEKRVAVKAAVDKPEKERTPEQVVLLKEYPSVITRGALDLYDPAGFKEVQDKREEVKKYRATKPPEAFLSILNEVPGQVPETHLFHRGDPDQPKQVTPPGELSILQSFISSEIAAKNPGLPTTGRRLAYAKHLVSGKHPLTSRVFVNRVWMLHFGRGIVATPGDFGFLGERPTHPELLDWLASELPATGWQVKKLHRLLMTSTAYRQSSRRVPAADAVDPDNRLLARMNVRRLEAEAVRDSILAAGDQLNLRQYGAPVPVMEDEDGQVVVGIENLNGENRPGPVLPMQGEDFRRSIYVQVRRSRPLAVLDMFDLPALDPNCTARTPSTVAPQSLLLMNSDFVLGGSDSLATRLTRDAGIDTPAKIRLAWHLIYGRSPAPQEVEAAQKFLAEQTIRLTESAKAITDTKLKPNPETVAWTTLCQALLSSNEFLYVD